MAEQKGWIAVDLDGTLAHYEGWKGAKHIGQFILPMVLRMRSLMELGWEFRIFTARASDQNDFAECKPVIDQMCLEAFGKTLPITNVKDYQMVELWDDRAVTVEKNTGKFLTSSTRGFE